MDLAQENKIFTGVALQLIIKAEKIVINGWLWGYFLLNHLRASSKPGVTLTLPPEG
jgi:hypothetical protein